MEKNNANDQFSHHSGTENYYTLAPGLLITDGCKDLAETFECYWLLTLIMSYQPQLSKQEFQAWKLVKNENGSADVTCDDGNGKILKKQHVPYTDFKADECTLWCVNNIIILPSEY